MAYVELHCLSNFSFLRGASHPQELVRQAAAQGYAGIAITDECSLAGVVRAHQEAKSHNIQLLIGSELYLEPGLRLVLLAPHRRAYAQLAHLISQGRRAAEKGEYRLQLEQLSLVQDCLAIVLPQWSVDFTVRQQLQAVRPYFGQHCWLAVENLRHGSYPWELMVLRQLSEQERVPLVACGGVHWHIPQRKALQDVLSAIRLGCTVQELGLQGHSNREAYLRPLEDLQHLYEAHWLAQTLEIARRCVFSLDELRYEYPAELVPVGMSATAYLRQLTEQGVARRWPDGAPDSVRQLLEHELALIAELGYEPYFLTVQDIVAFARAQGILCQGRGSAANSAVCFCLGVTEVDPSRMQLLFERFISRERDEPPDIDVDFEHERREEVIQYIYRKYGRERAALAATVITYRPRSALRDVGKALGMDLTQVERLAKSVHWWDGREISAERLRESGFDPDSRVIRMLMILVRQILGFPRHLSQHVGGFVISRGPLAELVPVENAAMPERTVIQWDKDDLEALGLLKVDVLALGMLTAVRRCLLMLGSYYQRPFSLAQIPPEDPQVYAMMQKADTIGVFQIESRAQMAMLPRLKPANFYDLVIEISLVRPGPIQGKMVHPYLRRRAGVEPVTYPGPAVESVLQRTLGVPIFQEQVIKLAMVAAGFSAGEADALRRAMAAWRRKGGLEPFEKRLKDGMAERGYAPEFAEQLFEQIKGFGEYGFPESHAASFALLVYISAWLKCYHPAAFTASLLNSQPMGFYAPAQLIADARRHGVEVLAVDVQHSDWDCSLVNPAIRSSRVLVAEAPGAYAPEVPYFSPYQTASLVHPQQRARPKLRLGLRLVKGLSRQGARALCEVRREGAFKSVQDLASRAGLGVKDLEALAAADALKNIAGHRSHAFWQAAGVERFRPLLKQSQIQEQLPLLDEPAPAQQLVNDYRSLGFSLRCHPMELLRKKIPRYNLRRADYLQQLDHGRFVRVAGLVTARQRPMTAAGVTFLTLEDESGSVNVVVWARLAEKQRQQVVAGKLLEVAGKVERDEAVIHLIAQQLYDYSYLLGQLETRSRDFH